MKNFESFKEVFEAAGYSCKMLPSKNAFVNAIFYNSDYAIAFTIDSSREWDNHAAIVSFSKEDMGTLVELATNPKRRDSLEHYRLIGYRAYYERGRRDWPEHCGNLCNHDHNVGEVKYGLELMRKTQIT